MRLPYLWTQAKEVEVSERYDQYRGQFPSLSTQQLLQLLLLCVETRWSGEQAQGGVGQTSKSRQLPVG